MSTIPPRKVTIEVDAATGDMTYRPAVLRARPGESVEWLCEDGDFALSFNARSPFPGTYFHGRRGVLTAAQVIAATASGSYHYHVAVRSEDGRIWLNSGSPEIFI